MAEKKPSEIAEMLVHAHRSKMPEPEDLMPNTPEARREAQKERHRPGFEDTVWFKMDIGRKQNADPRWILPLLCRRGHITRNEIGAIRIGPEETHFQIPRAIADRFADAARRTAGTESDEESIAFEVSPDGPRQVARENRKKRFEGGKPPRRKGVSVRPGEGGGKRGAKPGGKPYKKKFAGSSPSKPGDKPRPNKNKGAKFTGKPNRAKKPD